MRTPARQISKSAHYEHVDDSNSLLFKSDLNEPRGKGSFHFFIVFAGL